MIKYWKMKYNEWKLKGMLYEAILKYMENQKDILALAQNLYIALKDVPVTELRSELIERMAKLIHEDNKE